MWDLDGDFFCPTHVLFLQYHLSRRLPFPHWIAFAVCQTSAGIFVEPFLGLWWTDSSNFILSSQNRFVAILVILPFHIYFRRVLSIIYQKILVGILIGIMLNLYNNLGGTLFFIMLSLSVYEQIMSLHLFRSSLIYHFVVFIIQALYMFCLLAFLLSLRFVGASPPPCPPCTWAGVNGIIFFSVHMFVANIWKHN